MDKSHAIKILLANEEEAFKIFVLPSSKTTENWEFYGFANSIHKARAIQDCKVVAPEALALGGKGLIIS